MMNKLLVLTSNDTVGVLPVQVTVFKQPNYLENFVQATFSALPSDKVKGNFAVCLLTLVGSDYFLCYIFSFYKP